MAGQALKQALLQVVNTKEAGSPKRSPGLGSVNVANRVGGAQKRDRCVARCRAR